MSGRVLLSSNPASRVGVLCASIGYWVLNRVPFGALEYVATVSDAAGQRHAAIFKYDHGDSSATVMAVWLLEGSFKNISEVDLSGHPDVIWPISQSTPPMSWKGEGRLLIEVTPPFDVRTDVLFGCYYESERPHPYLCTSSDRIDVRIK